MWRSAGPRPVDVGVGLRGPGGRLLGVRPVGAAGVGVVAVVGEALALGLAAG